MINSREEEFKENKFFLTSLIKAFPWILADRREDNRLYLGNILRLSYISKNEWKGYQWSRIKKFFFTLFLLFQLGF